MARNPKDGMIYYELKTGEFYSEEENGYDDYLIKSTGEIQLIPNDEDDDTKESDNEQSISLNQKKKKNSGIRFRIQKKCKNINNYYTEGDDFEKDILDEFEIKELSYELEVL